MVDLVSSFHRDGFVVIRGCVPAALIHELRRALEEAHASSLSDREETTETGLWARFPSAEEIGRLPVLVDAARTLLGCSRLRLWQDQFILKRAVTGTATGLHRDAPYWPMREPTAITCWLPLGDVDKGSGALRFIRGSQSRLGRPGASSLRLQDELLGGCDSIIRPGEEITSVPMRPGDCTFHGGLVVHGAHENVSPRPRLSYKLVYMADGTIFRFQWHSATMSLGLQDGELIAGPGFPLLA